MMLKLTPGLLKLALNIYPPYLGTGIKIKHIRHDWRYIHVYMKLRWYNRNVMKAHFGGSLYSMVDPHLMLMLINILGPDYIVWDQSANIEFIKPGRGTVHSVFEITDEELETIRERTEQGEKYLPEFTIEILDEDNELVAKIEKVLYVRKRKEAC